MARPDAVTRRVYLGEAWTDEGLPVVEGARTVEDIDKEYRSKWDAAGRRYGAKVNVPGEVVDQLHEWLRLEYLARHGLDGHHRPLDARPVRRKTYEERAAARRRRQETAIRRHRAKKGAA